MSGLFSDATSLETFLQEIVSLIAKHMHSEVCSIYLYYDESDELVLKATKGLKPEAVGKVHMKLGEGLTGMAVKELRPVCVKEASKEPQYKYFPEIGEEVYESFLAVPILHGNSRIGAVVVQNSKKDYFTDDDIQVFRSITTQLATTIETARLLIRLDEKAVLPKVKTRLSPLGMIMARVGSSGFALGEAIVHAGKGQWGSMVGVDEENQTIEHFELALKLTEKQLEELQEEIEEKLSDVASLIFTAQILMLKDKPFIDAIILEIKNGVSPAKAIITVVDNYVRIFEGLPQQYLKEKKDDVLDIGYRLLGNLTGSRDRRHDYKDKIVVAEEMFPSDILKLSSQRVKGLVLLSGGITSHVSILARSLKLPVVIVEERALLKLASGTRVYLDTEEGCIYVNPNQEVLAAYHKRLEDQKILESLRGKIKARTVSKDGTRIRLLSNVNLLSDAVTALEYKSEGVGLYRTEFPFIVRSNFPSEEEQYQIYKKLVESFKKKEITFRTLDIGGDKVLSYFDYEKEKNPFLGMRSIRFSLKHKEIFEQQIRAILRAGVGANIKIMFPMISSMDEFLEAREVVWQCVRQLGKAKVPCHRKPKIGLMIELPAVLEIINELAEEADFFSIGTNDFIQYMLAVDRTNEKVAQMYLPHHPAVLRALKKVVDAARKSNKDLTVCGDMAHNPQYLSYLLGIGVRGLSVDSQHITKIQSAIQRLDLRQAKKSTQKLLQQNRISEVSKYL